MAHCAELERAELEGWGTALRSCLVCFPVQAASRRPLVFFDFVNVFVFIILGLLMTFVIITVSKVFAPRVQGNVDKFTTYECGERPVGPAWILFNFRFYMVALAFIMFDIELALIFPCATVFRKWLHAGYGLLVIGEIVVFVGILLLGLIYMWSRGDLQWSKEVSKQPTEGMLLEEERPIVF
jgi:NADH-quinone oxidoreductase subunit A